MVQEKKDMSSKEIEISEEMESCILYVPKHRYQCLLREWEHIRVIVNIGRNIDLHIDLQHGTVDLSTQPDTPDTTDLTRCAKFIQAIIIGFTIPVARKLLNRDNVYIDSLNITDIVVDPQAHKQLDARRMYSNIRKTKFAIEQSTTTNILMASTKIYILGSSSCIKNAKDYLQHLISLYFTQ